MKKNPVAHFEIYADDVDTLRTFYTTLFDWTIEPTPGMDYWSVRTADSDDQNMPTQAGAINGGMLKRPAGYPANAWVNYVMVVSLDEAVERAKSLGAKVTKDRSPVPGMGWFAMLIDPQGNHFAVFQNDPTAK